MSFSTRIGKLEATVKRLEAAAGRGQRHCAFCRLTLRHSWPDPEKPKPCPEDVIKRRCELCRSEYIISLAGIPEGQRDAYRLHYSFTLEERYTNPKAHALALWLLNRPERKKKREKSALAAKKTTKNPNARSELQEEVQRLFTQKHKRLRAKYGDPFPEHARLVESARKREPRKRTPGVYQKGLFELEREEAGHRVCAELEKIIWGQISAETVVAIERIGREIDELIRTAEEEAVRRVEESRLRNLEFLNGNRASVGLPPLPDDYGKG
jgi:hypothetical protein